MSRPYLSPGLAALLLVAATVPAMAAGQRTKAATPPITVQPDTAQPTAVQPDPFQSAASQAGTMQNAAAAAAPRFEPAPLPNQDLFAPVQRANEDPQVNPALFKPSTQFRGDGVLPGSSAQSYEERHLMPAAGLNLQVPLK
jgi:hypothetical protein